MLILGISLSSLEPLDLAIEEDGESLAPHHWSDWTKVEGDLVHCSVGATQVWGVSSEGLC